MSTYVRCVASLERRLMKFILNNLPYRISLYRNMSSEASFLLCFIRHVNGAHNSGHPSEGFSNLLGLERESQL